MQGNWIGEYHSALEAASTALEPEGCWQLQFLLDSLYVDLAICKGEFLSARRMFDSLVELKSRHREFIFAEPSLLAAVSATEISLLTAEKNWSLLLVAARNSF